MQKNKRNNRDLVSALRKETDKINKEAEKIMKSGQYEIVYGILQNTIIAHDRINLLEKSIQSDINREEINDKILIINEFIRRANNIMVKGSVSR